MQRVLVTGSNRGIGLAIVKWYLALGDVHVFATARRPDAATELNALAADNPVTVLPLDLNDEASIAGLGDALAAHTDSLDVLFNNAGIFPEGAATRSFGELQVDAVGHVVTTNSVAPVIVTQMLLPFLKKGTNPRVVMVSSQMGSITRSGTSGIAYRMSKAAMNMGAKVISGIVSNDGITVITTHPGHVATDMGGKTAPVTPTQSAEGLVTIANNLTMADTGKFFNYTGDEIPW